MQNPPTGIPDDVTEYIVRATSRMESNPRGVFRLAQVVDADDIAAIKRTRRIALFLRAVGPSFNMSVAEAAALEDAILVLDTMLHGLDVPGENWKEESYG